jgi:hypothetical protein
LIADSITRLMLRSTPMIGVSACCIRWSLIPFARRLCAAFLVSAWPNQRLRANGDPPPGPVVVAGGE